MHSYELVDEANRPLAQRRPGMQVIDGIDTAVRAVVQAFPTQVLLLFPRQGEQHPVLLRGGVGDGGRGYILLKNLRWTHALSARGLPSGKVLQDSAGDIERDHTQLQLLSDPPRLGIQTRAQDAG